VAVAICFRSDEALYGRYWGCRGNYHSLHFELCFYQGIAYCLQQGLARFEPGAGGEHKLSRGFTPTAVHSAHWIADPEMRALLARHLALQGRRWPTTASRRPSTCRSGEICGPPSAA
jgi:predicted N-acyltransferase